MKDTAGTAMRESDYNAPDMTYSEGVTLLELGSMFPDEDTARMWFKGGMETASAIQTARYPVQPQGFNAFSRPFRWAIIAAAFPCERAKMPRHPKLPFQKDSQVEAMQSQERWETETVTFSTLLRLLVT